jgi:hypothetical protein
LRTAWVQMIFFLASGEDLLMVTNLIRAHLEINPTGTPRQTWHEEKQNGTDPFLNALWPSRVAALECVDCASGVTVNKEGCSWRLVESGELVLLYALNVLLMYANSTDATHEHIQRWPIMMTWLVQSPFHLVCMYQLQGEGWQAKQPPTDTHTDECFLVSHPS